MIAPMLTWLGGCLESYPDADRGNPEVDNRRDVAGPLVVQVGNILLEEDQYYLGRPWSLVVDTADGSFLISDAFEGQIIRFGRDGSVVQRYGGPGEGPAEFQRIGPTFILNDTVVVGVDSRTRHFKLFSRGNGGHLETVRYRGSIGGDVTVVGGMVVAPAIDFDDDFTSVMVWDPGNGSFQHLVDLPAPYMRSLRGRGAFAAALAAGSVLAWPDTMLVGMAATNEVYLATWGGEVLDTIRPPSVRRRGVPDDAQGKFDTDQSLSFVDRVEMLSALLSMYRMLDGETVLVHYDQTAKGEPPTVEYLADIYVTVISSDRQSACVDGFVPYGNEIRARLTMSRDTLFLLDRTINKSEDGMNTWIRLYEIDTSRCVWLPVGESVKASFPRTSDPSRRQ
ncbi:MAG: hypothetical protein F4139_10375 [Gemmatimonadetes bacterium]|nr:hypothetical protein [Gemmatimonadota bacterium]MYH53341.1 hypothetical protein [Gemmatimonadota bacterium]MYI45939.1 hypothetical protein [Gemmatimonadota bacterium]MYK65355.1 hypothetical protein [Gemmatimonadota bacterium]